MMGVGMPKFLSLLEFGQVILDVFGHVPYHVGSSLKQKTGWRDVDVRLMLPDDEYEALGLGDPARTHQNAKWRGLVRAFSLLGQEMTGLPVDFQIQQNTLANREHGRSADCPRSALILITEQPLDAAEKGAATMSWESDVSGTLAGISDRLDVLICLLLEIQAQAPGALHAPLEINTSSQANYTRERADAFARRIRAAQKKGAAR